MQSSYRHVYEILKGAKKDIKLRIRTNGQLEECIGLSFYTDSILKEQELQWTKDVFAGNGFTIYYNNEQIVITRGITPAEKKMISETDASVNPLIGNIINMHFK